MTANRFESPTHPDRGGLRVPAGWARAMRALVVATLAGFLLIIGTAALPMRANAQTQALPTAPGADRASQGGLSEAPASLPKVHGASPLEPYLVTWLLPVSGILIAALCVGMDRNLRARGVR